MLRRDLPRDQVGIVFFVADQHHVAFLERKRSRDEVDSFGRVAGKHNFFFLARAKMLRDCCARFVHLARDCFAQDVRASAGARRILLVIFIHRVDHLPRSQRGAGVVEIHNRLAVDSLGEQWEVLSEIFHSVEAESKVTISLAGTRFQSSLVVQKIDKYEQSI